MLNPARILLQRRLFIALSWAIVLGLIYASTLSGWGLFALLLTAAPLGLLCYSRMHEHYHSGFSLFGKKHDALGVSYASLIGFSWVLYRVHHGNHHRYSNAKGDISRTTDDAGHMLVGWKYIWRNAVLPFLMQLPPYFIVTKTKKDKRSNLLWIDESCRVALRLGVLLIWGPVGLGALLAWQGLFLVFLFYFNYLQHFYVADGYAVVWESPFLNRWFLNGGYHDQHHTNPAWRADELPLYPSRVAIREKVGLFNPLAFLVFLVSTKGLAQILGVDAQTVPCAVVA